MSRDQHNEIPANYIRWLEPLNVYNFFICTMNTIDNLKSELMFPSKLNSFIKKEFGYEDMLYGNDVLPMFNPLHMDDAYNKTLSAYPTWVPFNADSRFSPALFDLNSLEEPTRLKPHNTFDDDTEHFEEEIQVKMRAART